MPVAFFICGKHFDFMAAEIAFQTNSLQYDIGSLRNCYQ